MNESRNMPSTRPWATWLAIAICFGAWLLRMHDSQSAPRDFWTMRQYSSALIARGLYYDSEPSIPDWKREVASQYRRWHAEPPIMEYAASRVFRVMGGESFWPFRLVTASGWVLGGWFLFLILRRVLDFQGALLGLTYYLFVPFGITSSVALHADPLMIFGLLLCTWGILWYCDFPTRRRLVLAGGMAGLALVFKPGPVVFSMFLTFFFCGLSTSGWSRKLVGHALGFGLLTLLPSVAVNLWAVERGWYRPGNQLMTYLSPHLFGTLYFWKGWLGRLLDVLSVPGFLLAGLGVLAVRTRKAWAVLGGWTVGYLIQSLLCSYTTPSHDYWHLQAIPMAAVCLGALAESLFGPKSETQPWKTVLGATVLSALIAAGAAYWLLDVWQAKRKGKSEDYVQIAQRIGAAVQHSTNTIILDYDYGAALKYFAEIDGTPWPWSRLMQFEQQLLNDQTAAGEPSWLHADWDADDRYRRFYADANPDYFVICRLVQELELQPGLRDFLGRYPVVAQSPRYCVWDLKNPLETD
mgnify:CR=1 FL=1